jgi:hypothetical protein
MRKALSVFGLLLFMIPAVASAGGVNLRWNQCFGEGTGLANRSFACNSNAGTEQLVASFLPSANLVNVVRMDAIVDLASASASLPAWWQLSGGGACRIGSLSASDAFNPADLNCADWSDGSADGASVSYLAGARGPNTARMLVSVPMQNPFTNNLPAWFEYFAFNLLIDHGATTGAGSCAGCETPVCIMLTSITMTGSAPASTVHLSGSTLGGDSNYVTWQGGGSPTVGSVTGCPAATPVRNRTWSSLKSMYR